MEPFEKTVDFHQELNPVLWENNRIKSDVKKALLKIALEYYDFLDIKVQIIDVVISGSQANYNYTVYSDIDLHLIVDYSDVKCDMDVAELFDTKRKLWKEQHDIEIHKIPVEVYVEDVNKPAVSSTYSLIEDKWIKEPKKVDLEINEPEINQIALSWIRIISAALDSGDVKNLEKVQDLLWDYRKKGLAKDGEFGIANLVFKTLRNSGATEMLLTGKRVIKDRNLSLENRL